VAIRTIENVASYGIPVVVVTVEDPLSKDELDIEAALRLGFLCRGSGVCRLERIQFMADVEKGLTQRSKRATRRKRWSCPLTIEQRNTHREKELLFTEEVRLTVTAMFTDPGISAVKNLALEELHGKVLLRLYHVLVPTLCEDERRLG
jgi:hypothetical protein